jgi:hypothetical protein
LPAPPAEFSAAGRRGPFRIFRQITRELHALDAGVIRLDPKQITDFARPADIADVDIAHRLAEIRVLALAGVLARARKRALPTAAIRPLPAARIAGGQARLAWAVFFFQLAPPLRLGPDLGHLFAQHGDEAVAFRDCCREFRVQRGGFCGVGFARQRREYIGRIEAGADEARGGVADPQMHVVAQADARTAPPGDIVGHGRFRNDSFPGRAAAFFMPLRRAGIVPGTHSRHARARPAHPSFFARLFRNGWIAGSSPAMTH